MSVKLSYEYIKSFIEDNNCKLISEEYIGINEKLIIKCACGNIFKVSFKIFRANNQRQCKECSNKNLSNKLKKTNEEFKKQVYDLVNDEYTLLSEYIKYHEHVKIRHNICGHEYNVTPANFITGYRCPKCYGVHKINTEIFKKKIFDIYNDEYTVLGEYKNNSTKIKIKHNRCGYEYMVRPSDILKGNKCPRCSGLERKNIDIIKKEVFDLVGNEYDVSGEYKNNKSKIIFKHNVCGNIFRMNSNNFISSKQRCPFCYESKGEQTIRHWFEKNNITYMNQYIFDDLLSDKNNPLRFDFALMDEESKQLRLLIEYDGEQHFKVLEGFNTKKDLDLQQKYDKRKDEYCQKHNLKLIRIPYWEFDNIEYILEREILHSRAS